MLGASLAKTGALGETVFKGSSGVTSRLTKVAVEM